MLFLVVMGITNKCYTVYIRNLVIRYVGEGGESPGGFGKEGPILAVSNLDIPESVAPSYDL